jgi:hypothetical protein
MDPSKLRVWARDFGITTVGVARLIGVSKRTIYSCRRSDIEACEPENWREQVIAGLEDEIGRLRKGTAQN